VLHQFGIPIVAKATRELADDVRPLLDFPQQQASGIAGDRATVKLPPYFSLIQAMKCKRFLGTLLFS
jgi:hypothetical protein